MSSTPSSSSSSTSSSSTENDLRTSESRSSQDEAEDKFDENTWFSTDEKMNKMTKESIIELLEDIPLPPPFSARVPALQEPANYGTDLETSVYEGQIRSGHRVPMHSFAVAFFNHYKMAPGQLVPNRWRKLFGLIYPVQTSGYPVTVDDFMRLYLEVCFIKNVANSVGCIDEPLSDQEMRHGGLIPPALAVHVPPTPVVESQLVLGPKTQELAIGTSSSRTPSLGGAKGDFLGLLQKASKGKRKEGTGEGSSPLIKRARAPTPPVPPLVVEDLPIDKDPIFHPRWTIKRGDFGMPSSHVSAQHLAQGVLPSDKLILENQPHEAFTMAHVQAAYNAYCYSSQMQDRFAMAMDVASTAETDKRAAEGKADKLDKEEGFQKAKELTMAKYPSLFLDNIVVPTFESPSGETTAPTEAKDVISHEEKSVRSGDAPAS
ncbi:hypothetical protein RJ639_042641 [Escallonia herrerae]|uniref:Transposase (putative) gypsy type domain-containing protein n=1 Tax=Escallonia herrerae TaxID=1293975 RepID=A0AA88WHI1_9ASTE|nr:hypothetical protein RJ639_042641 [Escallonia herrerae]